MKIYNTLTERKEEFEPIGDPVRMYVCGVTPYSDAHIGHAMSQLTFDMIRRYLEYRGYRVRYIQNFTDIDDKIIQRANRLGIPAMDLADKYIAAFYGDIAALGIKPATTYVRATSEIDVIVRIVQKLIDEGMAYPVEGGDVYFRVTRDEDYGKLSHRPLDEMEAGARVEVDQRKEAPVDFVLWKGAKPGEPSWPSPWGPGRPGWHIECSAIVLDELGEQIDIHGGGLDLVFPHHENEIAQSESYTHRPPFAKYWIHNGLLQLGGEKMSKSIGNLVTIKEALAAASADAIRFFMYSSHYRSPLAYTSEGVQAAERGVERLRAAANPRPAGQVENVPAEILAIGNAARGRFVEVMDDDLNTSAAIAQLFELTREINRLRDGGAPRAHWAALQMVLLELAGVLGFSLEERTVEVGAKPFIQLLVDLRQQLRAEKQWAMADRIRGELDKLGVTIEDRPDGPRWRLA